MRRRLRYRYRSEPADLPNLKELHKTDGAGSGTVNSKYYKLTALCTILSGFVIFLNGCLSEKHLLFENIPMNGNLENFTNELVKHGFTETRPAGQNQISLKGLFMEKNCDIFVYGTGKSQTVYMVRVNLPGVLHDSLKNSYEGLQKVYTSKYGRGTSKYRQFHDSPRFLFNEPKLVRQPERGDYTRFSTGSGTVTLEVRAGYISITYLDKKNDEIRKAEGEPEHREDVN